MTSANEKQTKITLQTVHDLATWLSPFRFATEEQQKFLNDQFLEGLQKEMRTEGSSMFNPRYRFGTEASKTPATDDAAASGEKDQDAENPDAETPAGKRRKTSASASSGVADPSAVGTEPGAPNIDLQKLLEGARNKAAAPES